MNYLEGTISGTTWQRAKYIQIFNEYNQPPRVEFIEEKIIVVGDEVIKQPVGGVGKTVTDYNEEIPIVNPETGEATGTTMTVAQVYAAIFSYYLKLAQERDAANQGGQE